MAAGVLASSPTLPAGVLPVPAPPAKADKGAAAGQSPPWLGLP